MTHEGERESVEQLYVRTVALLRYLARIRFGIPEDEVETLVQDVFLAYVRRNTEVFDPQAWLVGAISNASRKYWRTRGREVPLPPESAEWADDDALRAVTGIFDRMAFDKTISRLDDRGREVLRRFYVEGQSTNAIAEAFGTSTGAVQVLLHATRKRAHAIYRELMDGRP
jgi:RNA polymerase sigma factor (sigma-70 family)